MNRRSAGALFLAAALIAAASTVHAQPSAEIGASLMSATFGLDDEGVTTFGVPSGGFGILNPGVYASFFIGNYLAVEPQLGADTVRVSRSMVTSTPGFAASQASTGAPTATGTSPFFKALLRKMSANEAAMTARNP